MGIMDKFSAVEIKADNRISDADRAFCVRHQQAFDAAGPALDKIAEAISAAKTEQRAILGGDDSKYSYLSPWGIYISNDVFKCDEESVYEVMKKRNGRFITQIVDYFKSVYTLELDSQIIKEKLAAHKAERKKYEDGLRTNPIRYEQVVDEIFVQLGGFSFQERAMNEFLHKCWTAAHRYHSDEAEFEIKNDTLRLTGYWCHCKDESWRSHPEWEPADCLKVILDALVHFDIGQLNRGAEWFPELFRYSTEKNVFPINNLMKVRNIKLFKNGRVDIKFRDAVTVQEFVENYLRKQIGGMGDD